MMDKAKASKMRHTGSVIEKDGSEWETQRDTANREWYTNPKTGETKMAPDSAVIAAKKATKPYKKGGVVKSKGINGIAKRGHTRGRIV